MIFGKINGIRCRWLVLFCNKNCNLLIIFVNGSSSVIFGFLMYLGGIIYVVSLINVCFVKSNFWKFCYDVKF